MISESAARKILYARSGWICEKCGCTRAAEAHHRTNRSQGGRWGLENLLHLCGACHRWVTVNPLLARSQGGWSVPSHEDPAAVQVLVALRGWMYLDADGCFRTAEPLAA